MKARRPVRNEGATKRKAPRVRQSAVTEDDEMRPHYDFTGGERGKYAAAYSDGTNVVLLDPDVQKEFPDSRAVNEALRALIRRLR